MGETIRAFLKLDDREILQNAGSISAELAKSHAESEFEKYRVLQDCLFQSDFDKSLKQLEEQVSQHLPSTTEES